MCLKAYLCDESNGAILERGIIVAQLDDGSKSALKHIYVMNLMELY